MRQLFPEPREVDLAELALDYALLQTPHEHGRPFVRVSMAASLDGVTRGATGTSLDISNAEDRAHLLMLRACADAVLVGASTVRAYPYRAPSPTATWQELRREVGLTEAPRLAIVTSRGLPSDNPCFADSSRPPLVIVPQSCDEIAIATMRATGADVVVAGEDRVDIHELLSVLSGLGLRRIACEGGPALLTELSHAGVIDELCLTTTPVWLGGGDLHLTAHPPAPLAAQFTLTRLILGSDSTIFGQWRR